MEYSPFPSPDTARTSPQDDALQQQAASLARCQDNLRAILANSPDAQQYTVEQLLTAELSGDAFCHIRHWAGGVCACSLALQSLAPSGTTQPSPLLLGAIERAFGSLTGLCRTLQNAAPGSTGFVWLSSDREGQLQVNRTFQYATPLPLTPLLALPASLFPSPGICERLNFSTASRRYAAVLAQRSPNLYL
ncbi:MAG: hypothetical protein KBS74_03910 [Clostridiales bacterium]|nr:hypothetical protein [Candidatus Cacconaster stercorequi]